jgi:hypothetical protein
MFGWFKRKPKKTPPTAADLAKKLEKLTVNEAMEVANLIAQKVPEATAEDHRRTAEKFYKGDPERFRRDYGEEAYRLVYGDSLEDP